MKLIIDKDYESMSLRAAREVTDLVKKKPDAVLCLAAGDTPRLAYNLITQIAEKEKIDFSRAYFVSLDEWVGIPPENEGSCQFYLRSLLFNPMKIAETNIHVFNSLSPDLKRECSEMDDFIKKHNGIDLMIVGVGRNGHIGFNEPGVPFDKYSHIVDLDETTTSVGQKYFREATSLNKGITLGLKHLMESAKAILIANGIKKAEVIKDAIEGEISPKMPASIMRRHPNGQVIVDSEAASLLTNTDKIQEI
jgi:glucosamine-6-phosphate isomerase